MGPTAAGSRRPAEGRVRMVLPTRVPSPRRGSTLRPFPRPGAALYAGAVTQEEGGRTVFGDLLTPTHLVFLVIVGLLVFGPRRLPEIGSALGQSIRDFRRTLGQGDEAVPDRTPGGAAASGGGPAGPPRGV
jgi:sec-independent protein translocase protein TatA